MKTLLAAVALTIVSAGAQAQDAVSWGRAANLAHAECAYVGAAAMLMQTVGPREISEARACVDDKMQRAKDGFRSLPPQRSQAASAAIKDYFAAWIAAMQAVPGNLALSRRSAEAATAATKQRLQELWARFEIESAQ